MLKYITAITLFLLLGSFVSTAQQEPKKVIWGEKLKKTKNLGEFIYKDDYLYVLNFKLKAVQKISPDDLTLVSTLELEDKEIEIDGEQVALFNTVQSLINYRDGLGLFIEHYNDGDESKTYGFVKLESDLSGYDKVCQTLFDTQGKSENKRENRGLYHDSQILEGNGNYLALMSYRYKTGEQTLYGDLNVISNRGEDYSKEFTVGKKSGSSIHCVFSENAFTVQTLKDEIDELILYDGATGADAATLSLQEFLEEKYRVSAIKKLNDGSYLLSGFYGSFTSKDGNQMHGFFVAKVAANGTLDEENSYKFPTSEITSTVENATIQDVLITDEESVFIIMTSSDGSKMSMNGNTTVYEQLMVVGIDKDNIWSKSIPFRQGYGAMVWDEHLGPKITDVNGHLILAFNDHRDNGKTFDYSNYNYSKDTRPSKYTCSLPDVITIIDIDKEGEVDPYFINVYEIFTNLIDIQPLNDGTLFFSGGTATIAGPGKTRFAKVILK